MITQAAPADIRTMGFTKAPSLEYAASPMPQGPFAGGIEVRAKGEWQRVFETEPCYSLEVLATEAMDKFVLNIKENTPYVGRVWPMGKPVPHGFAIGPGRLGERVLIRDKKYRRDEAKGPRHMKGGR